MFTKNTPMAPRAIFTGIYDFTRYLPILLLISRPVFSEDWPQWLGTSRDGVWRETGILTSFPPQGPSVLWRVPIGGGYAGPTVSRGRVLIADRFLTPGSKDSENLFQRSSSFGKERVLCLNADNGTEIWKHSYDCAYNISYPCGPRISPTIHQDFVYTIGSMGDLKCLTLSEGKLQWSVNFVRDFGANVPVWGFACHPIIIKDLLITLVGGKDPGSLVIAFNLKTGKVVWKSLQMERAQSEIGYSSPTLIELNGIKQLIIWHPEGVASIDPETGKKNWLVPFFLKANLSVATPRLAGNSLLVSSFYNGSMLLNIASDASGAGVTWQSKGRGERPEQTDGLHSIMSTPFIHGDNFYGICSYGELRCLDLKTGKRLWSDMRATGSTSEPVERWANAFIIKHEDRYFLWNEKGDLIIAHLNPTGYHEVGRVHLLDPTGAAPGGGPVRKIIWSHPAFAMKSVFARNDREVVRVSLAR